MDGNLRVGMSSADITPPAPVSLLGQFHTRISEYVESPLQANVWAAESGGDQIIICACDVAHVSAAFCESTRRLIRRERPGIDAAKIILCATHTHTAPVFFRDDSFAVAAKYLPEGIRYDDEAAIPGGAWPEDRCGEYMARRLCAAICDAWDKREDALFSPAFGRAVTGHCRRAVYEGGTARMYGDTGSADFDALEAGSDSGVELLYFFHEDKRPMGALANVACPSQCVETARFISSDFWGKARDAVTAGLGGGFVLVGLCAPSGDQSPRDLIRLGSGRARRGDPDMFGLAGAAELGRRVAGAVLGKLEEASEDPGGEAVIRHQAFSMDFPLRTVSVTEYEEAKRQFGAYVVRSGKNVFSTREISDLYRWGGVMDRFREQQRTRFYRAEIHVARFDDMAFATSPFELFLDYGNRIRARSAAAQTILIQLACDVGGSLPTRRAEQGGGHSADVPGGKTGSGGGDLLVAKTLDVIGSLWDEPAAAAEGSLP